MKSDKFYVCMYVKREYMFSQEEDMLDNLSMRYKGMPLGSGTNLMSGKRDVSFSFPSRRSAVHFLSNKIVHDITYRPVVREVKS
jgi:hypothetical protein